MTAFFAHQFSISTVLWFLYGNSQVHMVCSLYCLKWHIHCKWPTVSYLPLYSPLTKMHYPILFIDAFNIIDNIIDGNCSLYHLPLHNSSQSNKHIYIIECCHHFIICTLPIGFRPSALPCTAAVHTTIILYYNWNKSTCS